MAYRRSHYRRGYWRHTKNGPVWVSPTYVSGHNFEPNPSGNPYGHYSNTFPNHQVVSESLPLYSRSSPSTKPSNTIIRYEFNIPKEAYEEKYKEAKALFSKAKSSDDYQYVEAFFSGLGGYKNCDFYIDLCRKHSLSYKNHDIIDAISKEQKSLHKIAPLPTTDSIKAVPRMHSTPCIHDQTKPTTTPLSHHTDISSAESPSPIIHSSPESPSPIVHSSPESPSPIVHSSLYTQKQTCFAKAVSAHHTDIAVERTAISITSFPSSHQEFSCISRIRLIHMIVLFIIVLFLLLAILFLSQY